VHQARREGKAQEVHAMVTRDDWYRVEPEPPSWPIVVVILGLLATMGFMVLSMPEPKTADEIGATGAIK
jgi:hypothetical protein